MNTTHTPTPWIQKGNKVQAGAHQVESIGISITGKAGEPKMVTAYTVNFYVRKEEDAAFIVEACNSHDAILSDLKDCHDQITSEWSDSHKWQENKPGCDRCTLIAKSSGKVA